MTSRPHPARRFGMLFIVLFAGLILTACQAAEKVQWATVAAPITRDTQAAETPAPISLSTATPVPTPTDDPGKRLRGLAIEFWHPWRGDLADQVDAAVTEFNRTNKWGFTVKTRPFYSDGALDEAVSTGLQDASAGLPHLIAAPGSQIIALAGQKNAIISLDALISSAQYGFSEAEISAFHSAFWAQDQAAGRQVAIPALRDARVLFYNESWAKELGFSGPPKTPAEFKSQACAAATANNTSRVLDMYGTGGWIVDTDPITTLSWFYAFGAQPVPGEVGKPYAFKGDEAEDTFAFLRDLLDDGCGWVARNPAPYEYFAERMALFYSGTLEDIAVQSRWSEKLNSKDTWRVLPFMSTAGKPVVIGSGYSYAVFQSKPETELAAWLFIQWMQKPAVAVKLIQAMPSLPVSASQAEQLKSMQASQPWNMILPITEPAHAAPNIVSWLEVRRLVEDAAWQIYHAPPEGVPAILPELDKAVQGIPTK